MPRGKPVTSRRKIEQGSAEHRAILGIDNDMPPEEKAKLELALKTTPIVIAKDKDIPWVSKRGERLPGGWVRRGE
jgi:hypothetical protein